jgi:lipoate synthase
MSKLDLEELGKHLESLIRNQKRVVMEQVQRVESVCSDVRARINLNSKLNSLGELQQEGNMLDAKIGRLVAFQDVWEKIVERTNQ